jgi:nucleotide-binding universal stress UspA family protein
MKPIRLILHPSDFSRASRPAYARAVDMATSGKAELLLAHVLPPVAPLFGDGYVSAQTFNEIDRSARDAGQKQLDALVARARKAGARARGLLLDGAPHVAIVRAARTKRADIIVMGTHGRGGLARLFLGSVAGRVIATAPCPVLTVRPGSNG